MVQLTLEQRKLVIEEMVQHHSPTKTVRKVNLVFGIKVSIKCVRENFFKWNHGATAHTARSCMEWLKNRFPGKLISHKSEFPWPARPPDLSPLDYFLWGFLKDKVFSIAPSDISDLKTTVRSVIEAIDSGTLQTVIANFAIRNEKCIVAMGGHFKR